MIMKNDSADCFLFQKYIRQPEPNIPDNIKADWIGPPDSTSNMRPIKFYIAKDETKAEKHFRILREETQNWNQEFWAKHNRNFTQVDHSYKLGMSIKDIRKEGRGQGFR